MKYLLIFVVLSLPMIAQPTIPFAFMQQPVAGGYPIPLPVTDSLVARFRADTLFTKSSGDTLSVWDDVSGNDHHANQFTDALKPEFYTAADSTFAMIKFDGVDDYLRDLTLDTKAQPNTIIIVARSYKASVTGAVFDGVGAQRQVVFQNGANWGAFAGAGVIGLAGVISIDTTYIITLRFSGNASSIRANGIEVAGAPGTDALVDITIGADASAGSSFSGRIHEVLVYEGLLTIAEVAELETYLATKWGVTLP